MTTCQELGLGHFERASGIERGTHHVVWHVITSRGHYAIRASSKTTQRSRRTREQLWDMVGDCGAAPKYRGSVRIHRHEFDGWLEVFDWAQGRHLRPTVDHIEVARTLGRLHRHPIPRGSNPAPRVALIRFLQNSLSTDLHALRGRNSVDRLLRAKTNAALKYLSGLPRAAGAAAIVHNDLVDGNVIRHANGIVLIDWDWAMVTQPEVDLFCFLSPFVRSWRSTPRFVNTPVAVEFLNEYRRCSERRTGPKSPIDLTAWRPYNILIANWLRRQKEAPPHAGSLAFYERSFVTVDKLASVMSSD